MYRDEFLWRVDREWARRAPAHFQTRWRRRNDKISGKPGVWRSPVAHLLWEQGVGGSNPLTPTIPTSRRRPRRRAVVGDRFLEFTTGGRPQGGDAHGG